MIGGRSTRLRRRADGLLKSSGRGTPALALALALLSSPAAVVAAVSEVDVASSTPLLDVAVAGVSEVVVAAVVATGVLADSTSDLGSLLAVGSLAGVVASLDVAGDDKLANDVSDSTPGMIEPVDQTKR